MDTEQLLQLINGLQSQIDALKSQLNVNNFSSSQDFQKYSRFNTRLKVPRYTGVPTFGDVGEIIEISGKLYICSAAGVWTIVGTQV